MKSYYRHDAESEHGDGVCYIEITGRWPTRQVEVYGEIWFCGDEEHNTYLADQPFEYLALEDEHAIAPEEFERVWDEAVRRCRPAT